MKCLNCLLIWVFVGFYITSFLWNCSLWFVVTSWEISSGTLALSNPPASSCDTEPNWTCACWGFHQFDMSCLICGQFNTGQLFTKWLHCTNFPSSNCLGFKWLSFPVSDSPRYVSSTPSCVGFLNSHRDIWPCRNNRLGIRLHLAVGLVAYISEGTL